MSPYPEWFYWDDAKYCLHCAGQPQDHLTDGSCHSLYRNKVAWADTNDNSMGEIEPGFWSARKAYLVSRASARPTPRSGVVDWSSWAKYTGLSVAALKGMKL